MLSLVSNKTRIRPRTRKVGELNFKGTILDVVVVATSEESITNKLIKRWDACPGVLAVKCVDRHQGKACVEIVVDGHQHESGWKRCFGTADKRVLPQAILDTLNKL